MIVRRTAFWCVLALAGCGGRVELPGSNGVAADGGVAAGGDSGLSQSLFQLPQDGETGRVGPFCCSGKTVAVRGRDGQVRGYAYFYDFGPAYNRGDTSYSTSFVILLADANGKTGRIEFEAKDVHSGDSKSAQVGRLVFGVVVTRVDVMSLSNQQVFDMQTLAVELSVAIA